MSEKQSTDLSSNGNPSKPSGNLAEPKPINSTSDLLDGRGIGNYASRYPFWPAWTLISAEFIYLISLLLFGLYHLTSIAVSVNASALLIIHGYDIGTYPNNNSILVWIVMGFAGLSGGCASVLKWHYHSVAKSIWNIDRTFWRLIVPLLSAVLATFTGMMAKTGLLPPIFNQAAFDSLIFSAGLGFFLGYFSDNLLAWLTRFAKKTFGTVDTKGGVNVPSLDKKHE